MITGGIALQDCNAQDEGQRQTQVVKVTAAGEGGVGRLGLREVAAEIEDGGRWTSEAITLSKPYFSEPQKVALATIFSEQQ